MITYAMVSQVCAYFSSLDSIVNLSVNWPIDSLFVEFWPKIDLGKE